MSKPGPQNTGKQEVLDNTAQYTPLKRIYNRDELLRWQPKDGLDINKLKQIAEAGVLKIRSPKL